jgi:signal transduction histidine kinase/CheY-like chemotaxis protein
VSKFELQPAGPPDSNAPPRRGAYRYGLAVVFTLAALGIRAALDPLIGSNAPFFTFVLSTLMAAWFCGFGPALFAGYVGGALAVLVFIPLGESSGPSPVLSLLIYGLIVTWIAVFGRATHRSWKRDALALAESRNQQHSLEKEVQDRKQAEAALLEADRRKDEFLATLAHELRNPLAPVRNSAVLLHDNSLPAPERVRCLDIIDRQIGHMARLLEDLLDVSRITRGKFRLVPDRVALADVISPALEAARPVIDAGHHQLAVSLPPQAVWLHADPVRLAQVFTNLLTNAAKYTPPGGRIRLSATIGPMDEVVNFTDSRLGGAGSSLYPVLRDGPASAVIITVEDNGIGIAPDHLPRLFDLFSQVDTALERSQGGLGIGLSLARALVEMHAGTITAQSAGTGRGSTFKVCLPVMEIGTLVKEIDVIPATSSKPPAENGAKPRLLIVDDNKDAAVSLGVLLSMQGYETKTAYDGLTAVEVAERFRPDAVILDLGLPKLNGFDAAVRIREAEWGRNLLLVALTGWGHEDDRRKSRAAGFDHHIVKPVDPRELRTLLDQSLMRH